MTEDWMTERPMAKLDLTKPVQTRDGCAVRILCVDAKSPNPVVGIVADQGGGYDIVMAWDSAGRRLRGVAHEHPTDLVNVPEHEWICVYRVSGGAYAAIGYPTEASARKGINLTIGPVFGPFCVPKG